MKNSADRAAVQRPTWLLLLSQSLSSAAFITRATIGPHLSGQAALAAYPAARMMDRRGRSGRLLKTQDITALFSSVFSSVFETILYTRVTIGKANNSI